MFYRLFFFQFLQKLSIKMLLIQFRC